MFRLLFVICNLFGILGIWLLEFAQPSWAQCPVCIVTVGGGMLLAKKLGVDDLLVSVWISALNTAISFWLAPKLKIKNFKLKIINNPYLLSFILYLLSLVYFQFTDQINSKIHLGLLAGLLAMFFGNFVYGFTKFKNNRRPLFPYAKVVFPLLSVILTTLISYLIINSTAV